MFKIYRFGFVSRGLEVGSFDFRVEVLGFEFRA